MDGFDWTPYIPLIVAIVGGSFAILAYNSRHVYRSLMKRRIGRRVNWASRNKGDSKAERYFIDALRRDDLADKYDRRKAAEFLGEIGDQDSVDVLVRALVYDNYDIQKAAARALGRRNLGIFTNVENPLIDALMSENAGVRSAAAEALGELGSFKAVDFLNRTLKDIEWYVRRDAAEALGKIGGQRPAQYLILSLDDDDADVRIAAAQALGKMAETSRSSSVTRALNRATAPLTTLLNDYDPRVREEGAISLGKIGDSLVWSPLVIRLSNDVEPAVRAEAAISLGKVKAAGAIEALISTLKNDDDGFVRSKAADALGEIGHWAPITPLCDALQDLDLAVQMAAADALGKMKDPSAIPCLIEALRSPAVYPRTKAAKALGEIGEPAEEPLNQLLKDENDPEVRKLIEDFALPKIVAEKYYPARRQANFCRLCGKKLGENAHFCSACGILQLHIDLN
jgi:HEAT repeat protein